MNSRIESDPKNVTRPVEFAPPQRNERIGVNGFPAFTQSSYKHGHQRECLSDRDIESDPLRFLSRSGPCSDTCSNSLLSRQSVRRNQIQFGTTAIKTSRSFPSAFNFACAMIPGPEAAICNL